MKTATIHDLKEELLHSTPAKILELCLRLARFKKENKELLTFLLFEANDIRLYIKHVIHEISLQFEDLNASNVYFAKKSLRKILRIANKHIRYSNSKTVETELLIHFCKSIQSLNPTFLSNPIILNIYQNQIRKINKAVISLHEDLQYDYRIEIDGLENPGKK
jgi:hypothetical protein